MIPTLLRRWDEPRFRVARSLAVLAFGLLATLAYGRFLGRTYPVAEWLFWPIAKLWLWGAFLSLACVSFGHLLLTRVFRAADRPALETIVTSAALGLVAFVLGMYAGGFLHQFNAPFAILWPSAMLAAGARPLSRFARAQWSSARAPRPDPLYNGLALFAALAGVVCVVFVYLGAFTPVAINFDSEWTHIPTAADYARAGRIIPFAADYSRCVPHLASLVHTWAFLVPGISEKPLRWMLAQHLEFFFFLWTLAGVAAMARYLLSEDDAPRPPPRATWAAFFLFPAIFVYDSNLGGSADHYLAFFAAPLFITAARAARDFAPRPSALAGALAAGALLTKYQALYLIFGVGVIYAGAWAIALARRLFANLRKRESPMGAPPVRALILGPLAFIGALVLVSSPHFLKNWVFYKNPVYPFALDLFPSSTPTTPHAAYLFEWLFKDYKWRPHGTFFENVHEAARLAFSFSFTPHYSFTKDVPNVGSLFTIGLCFIPFLRAPRRIALGAVAGLCCVFMWAMTFQVDRHLQTFMPILAATTAAVLVRAFELGKLAQLGVVPLVALQIVWGGDAIFYSSEKRFDAAMKLINTGFEGKTKHRFDYRSEYMAVGESLPPDARVLLHSYRLNLGIDRDIFMDMPGQQGLFLYEGIRGPRGLYDTWRSHGITHVLYVPGFRPAQSKQDEVLFAEFTERHAPERRHIGHFELYALPATPPPPATATYHVLAMGLAGYQDGLYPVEAMNTYEGLPKHLLRFARPEVPLPKEPAAIAALADKAQAIAIGARFQLDRSARDHINGRFETVVSYSRGFSILLRRKGGVTAPSAPVLPTPPASSAPSVPSAPSGAPPKRE